MLDIGAGRVVVVGAGIGGLAAAAALADAFAEVVIVERDALPSAAQPRAGVPQGKHVHGLLGGGLKALEALLPGFGDDLSTAGAVTFRPSLDVWSEQPGYDPFPRRDFDLLGYSMSRPLLEHVLRRRVTQLPSVRILSGRAVRKFDLAAAGDAVVSVSLDDRQVLHADLFVDASGRGALTLDALSGAGIERPRESAIGVDIRYTCAVLSTPGGLDVDWKVLQTRPDPRVNGRRAIMFPLEGANRWLLGLGGTHGDAAPNDPAGFIDYAATLRTGTAAEVLRQSTFEGEIARFAFPSSIRRRFEDLLVFPRGLVPIGDAICRINPAYGQGMSLAAKEALLLKRLISDAAPTSPLASRFFAGLGEILDYPWAVAAGDFAFAATTGDKPDDYASTARFNSALSRLAAEDAEVHRLMLEVGQLIRSPDVYEQEGVRERLR